MLCTPTIPPKEYVYTLAIPVFALGSYELLVYNELGMEVNAILILTAGPISVWCFARAIIAAA